MKKKTAVIILAFLAVCLCSCSKSKNDSGIDSEYVKTASVVTEESTEETTEVRGADMCPLYMYYEGDLYIPAVNPEDRLIFDTAELKDYKYVGKTTFIMILKTTGAGNLLFPAPAHDKSL